MNEGRPRVQKSANHPAAGRDGRAWRLLAMLAAVCALVILIRGRIYVIREIEVTGNSERSASEIAGQSGLRLGMNIFNVDRETVERNLSANPCVEVLDIEVILPDTVVLHIRERTACAAVNCAGVILMVSEDGYILERLTSVPPTEKVVVVSGMDVKIGPQGRTIESGVAGQKNVMEAVLAALRTVGMEKQVSELNVADLDNLYLMSDSGVQVLLGDETQLEDKLVWMRAVLEKLTRNGVMSGVLDVSSGKNAVYSEK